MSDGSEGLSELSAEQYRTLIEETSDVISIIDEDGTVLFQSQNSESVKGWPRRELIGENILDYIHPDDREMIVDAFDKLLSDENFDEEVEFRFQRADGEWVWLATTGTTPGSDGPIDGFITTSRNITERKRTEQKLKSQRDDLELLNQVVRHDIRNDLQVVSTYAELLEDHVDEDGQKHLERLKQSNEQAVELTTTARDLTDVILQSDTETELEAVPLKSVVETEISEIQSSQTDAEFTVDDSLSGVSVLADEMIETVFRNILKNAIQHNDKAQPQAEVTAETDEKSVTVRLLDNGPGIPDSQKETVFGKGEKGLESEGTGLGLYLVREIITGYGGEIWVEDRQDRDDGSVFVIELERAD